MKSLSLLLLSLVLVTANQNLDWWESGVFYQIYPRSFSDSDGDGIGDIRGIINNLDHLVDLGVDGFWLGPVFRSPMQDGGYDITDYRQVDPIFGTNADLQSLFTQARLRGLKVILDYVPNHTSDQHDWFLLSANRTVGFEDYYLWRDCPIQQDGTRRMPNNWIAVFHTRMWTHNPVRDQCFLHQFTPHQPDLNNRNPAVRAANLNVARFLFGLGVDGLRVDGVHVFETDGLPNEQYVSIQGDRNSRDNLMHVSTINRPESFVFMQDLRRIADEFSTSPTLNRTRIIIAQTNANLANQLRWYGNDDVRGAHIPLNYALFGDINRNTNALALKNRILDMFDVLPGWAEPNWVLGNHDTPRIATRYGKERHESMAILSLLLPGPAMIYYGEEILMTDHRGITFEESDDPMVRQTNSSVFMQFSRDPARTPFQWDNTTWAGFSNTTFRTWLPVHPEYLQVNLRAQKEAEKSTYKLYKSLLALRYKYDSVLIGGYAFKVLDTNVLGFVRTMPGVPTIAVIINLGPTANAASLRDLLEDEYPEEVTGTILTTNTNSSLSIGMRFGDLQQIHLGPFDAVVIEVSSAGKVVASAFLLLGCLLKFIL